MAMPCEEKEAQRATATATLTFVFFSLLYHIRRVVADLMYISHITPFLISVSQI